MSQDNEHNEHDDLYPAHLKEWAARFEAALESAGLDSVVIFAGAEQVVFRDDSTYPFIAEPYFKAWAPLTHHPDSAIRFTPGQRPRLLGPTGQMCPSSDSPHNHSWLGRS